jgi:hypothetical protein
MSTLYSRFHEHLYKRLSLITGMSKHEIDIFMLKLVKILVQILNKKGKVNIPYLGRFYLVRIPARRIIVRDFKLKKMLWKQVPAGDQLRFKINEEFAKLFK